MITEYDITLKIAQLLQYENIQNYSDNMLRELAINRIMFDKYYIKIVDKVRKNNCNTYIDYSSHFETDWCTQLCPDVFDIPTLRKIVKSINKQVKYYLNGGE